MALDRIELGFWRTSSTIRRDRREETVGAGGPDGVDLAHARLGGIDMDDGTHPDQPAVKSWWHRYRPSFVNEIVLAGSLTLAFFVISEYREDRRQERMAELEGARADQADKRALQIGLTLDDELDGLTLPGFDLSGLQLPSRSLVGANLEEADLSESDLSGADLSDARLLRVRFRSSELVGANLSRAVLVNADLSGADLRGASLYAARLTGANLSRVDLAGADLGASELENVDLTDAYWDDQTVWPEGFEPPTNAGAPRCENCTPRSTLPGG